MGLFGYDFQSRDSSEYFEQHFGIGLQEEQDEHGHGKWEGKTKAFRHDYQYFQIYGKC
jgi:hypothetical protein